MTFIGRMAIVSSTVETSAKLITVLTTVNAYNRGEWSELGALDSVGGIIVNIILKFQKYYHKWVFMFSI